LQFESQRNELLDPIIYGSKVFGHERIDLAASHIRLILERKQFPDCLDVEAERTGLPNEREALQLLLPVTSAVAFGPGQRRQ
jgi:hypothetical protein